MIPNPSDYPVLTCLPKQARQAHRRKPLYIVDHDEQINAFETCREELLEYGPEYLLWGVLQFDLISWLDSKIEEKPFADVLRAKEMQAEHRVVREMEEFQEA